MTKTYKDCEKCIYMESRYEFDGAVDVPKQYCRLTGDPVIDWCVCIAQRRQALDLEIDSLHKQLELCDDKSLNAPSAPKSATQPPMTTGSWCCHYCHGVHSVADMECPVWSRGSLYVQEDHTPSPPAPAQPLHPGCCGLKITTLSGGKQTYCFYYYTKMDKESIGVYGYGPSPNAAYCDFLSKWTKHLE